MRYCQENKKECALAHSRAEARRGREYTSLNQRGDPRGAFLSYGNEVSYTIIKSALAHSRAEARLPWQPSTLAPSAHPRGAFLSYGNEVSYTIKNGVPEKGTP